MILHFSDVHSVQDCPAGHGRLFPVSRMYRHMDIHFKLTAAGERL